MKKFEEILTKNNIKQPLWGKKKFEQRWNEVRAIYEQWCKEVEELNGLIEELENDLQKRWDTDFSEFVASLYHVPEFVFRNCKQACDMIEEERETVKVKRISLYNLQSDIQRKARKNWVDQLVSEAPENCNLVVIRGKYTPEELNVNAFERRIAEKKSAAICMMFSPIWIAFNPQEKYNTQLWIMDKNTSTVEYI